MKKIIAFTLVISFYYVCLAAEHPYLFLTREFLKEYKVGAAPLFDKSLEEEINIASGAILTGTALPRPKEASGEGSSRLYYHHMNAMVASATAWQFTGEKKYAEWVRNLLLEYAKMYPTLGWHPESGKTGEPGRLFYQMLDDCEWTARAAIAYDCIYDFLTSKERKTIEYDLLVPSARFLMEGTAENRKNEFVFNRMHNHGTWAILAVGLVGLVTGNEEFINKSLYGTDLSGKNGGLLKQIDELFSPDGYYYEGAYYQGYALIPALVYAQCLDKVMPELDIFHRNSSALLKSAQAMFNLSYCGKLFKMNDSCSEEFNGKDIVYATDIIYFKDTAQKQLLSIAEKWHEKVLVCEAGYRTAMDIKKGLVEEMKFNSCIVRDGKDGRKGATMVLRSSDGTDVLTMKACGQGGYHGHFDKLTLGYYSEGEEVLKDYGFARYPGLCWKENGRYTSLNRSYAMTTVAHNTLVVDTSSHFKGITPHALPYSPQVLAFNCEDSDFQYMAAMDTNAVKGVKMERWSAMAKVDYLEKPLVIDILRANSDSTHIYDLPYHYDGQVMNLSVPQAVKVNNLRPLGNDFGYQHLWLESEACGIDGTVSFTYLQGKRFHTITCLTDKDTEIMLLRLGANDPDYILDRHPAYMMRKIGRNAIFVNCVETHGHFDSSSSWGEKASCKGIGIKENNDALEITFTFEKGENITIIIDNNQMRMIR